MFSTSSTTLNTPVASTFPQEVTKTLIFLATSQDDLDFLNDTSDEDGFRVEAKHFASDICVVELVSVDGVKFK